MSILEQLVSNSERHITLILHIYQRICYR